MVADLNKAEIKEVIAEMVSDGDLRIVIDGDQLCLQVVTQEDFLTKHEITTGDGLGMWEIEQGSSHSYNNENPDEYWEETHDE